VSEGVRSFTYLRSSGQKPALVARAVLTEIPEGGSPPGCWIIQFDITTTKIPYRWEKMGDGKNEACHIKSKCEIG
jgi:hypothetical protein